MTHSTRKLGNTFTWLGWIIGFFLLALLFQKLLDQQNNPNRAVKTLTGDGFYEIELQRNRYGHYVLDGEINRQKVTFLIDTGATTTSIPEDISERLGLRKGLSMQVETANGTTTAYRTRLDSLNIGLIEFNDVLASINPGFDSDEILLGMNILKNLELVQRGETMIIRTPQY
jgi:aspartyl protease family protein